MRDMVAGDVIAIKRLNGLYVHFAVYVGDNKVIHFAAPNGDFGLKSRPIVHEAPIENFLGNDSEIIIVDFGNRRESNLRVGLGAMKPRLGLVNYVVESVVNIYKGKKYHLYSNEETVSRARRIAEAVARGEKSVDFNGKIYFLVGNNCENFALWCKTGISESYQVQRAIGFIEDVVFSVAFPILIPIPRRRIF